MRSRGVTVSKVVFRGYLAPQRLQKMHDESIEKRTRLVLECESEKQEQSMLDARLQKEAQRNEVKRGMEKASLTHQAEMQRTAFEAKQREARETAEQECTMLAARQDAELTHLSR